MTPRVSVVIASYNYGRFIAAALASVRAQSFFNWEAIVVDDGSTDGTLAAVKPFLRDRRFRLVRQEHAGQSRAKNRGLGEARGEFIAFLDADDCWRRAKLKRQVGLMCRRPAAGLCYTGRTFIDPDGQPAGDDNRRKHRGQVLNEMFRDNFVCYSSVMIRRVVFDHLGGFDERLGLAIDYDWWLRVARHYAFEFVDEPLVEYRVGHANLSRRVADRLDTALAAMQRFRLRYDRPAALDARLARGALAETLRHRGVVGRGGPGAGLSWLLRSAAVAPLDPRTWRAAVAAVVPARLRHLVRRLRGNRDWEAALTAPAEVV